MDATWTTLVIVGLGVTVVIGGILIVRLHAFLALMLAAVVVSGLTSPELRVRNLGYNAVPGSVAGTEIDIEADASRLAPGTSLTMLRQDQRDQQLFPTAELKVQDPVSGAVHARALVVDGSIPEESEGRRWIVTTAVWNETVAADRASLGGRIAAAFGSTCGKIGLIIAFASIIGICLLESGAADRIIRASLKLFGEAGAAAGFIVSGFVLAIPVFFDTVFYLMIPLGKALRLRTGRNYLLYVLAIVAGGTMAHSLVPPTPGPLFVAEELGVDLGTMMLAGIAVGSVTAVAGYFFAVFANSKLDVPLRESAEFRISDLERIGGKADHELPSLWLSLTPILLPVLMIAGAGFLEPFVEQWYARSSAADGYATTPIARAFANLGDKNLALGLAAAISMWLVLKQSEKTWPQIGESIQRALSGGGMIILITAAGGAFGNALQQTGVAGIIRDLPTTSPAVIIVMAFLITTAVRTAQGSSTVAMITTVGLLSALVTGGNLGCHPVYVALAIGCGSKPFSWMNDSGFWVISRMSGMTESETLRTVTPMTAIMGTVGLVVTLVSATIWPAV